VTSTEFEPTSAALHATRRTSLGYLILQGEQGYSNCGKDVITINAVCMCTETISLVLRHTEYRPNSSTIPTLQIAHLTGHPHQNTMPQSRAAAEKEVRSWGFNHIFTWSDGP